MSATEIAMKSNRTGRRSGIGIGTAAWLVLTATLATGTAYAQTTNGDAAGTANPPNTRVRASEVGHSTRDWLELQRSNRAAAPAQPTLGAEAGLAYQRYMDSFKTKIPSSFGSSLSDNGNQLHVDYTNGNGGAQN
jgi:Protein of unknown function (DUF3613)